MQISSRAIYAFIAAGVVGGFLAASTPVLAQQAMDNQAILPPADIPNVPQQGLSLTITITGTTSTSLSNSPDIAASQAVAATVSVLQALENAAEKGQPTALWRLGMMYESGDGVDENRDKAFAYFSEIANNNAEASPTSPNARIIARSFLKISDYLHSGYQNTDIPAEDTERSSKKLLLHAASYFGDSKAQFDLGTRYLDGDGFTLDSMRGARWLLLAAKKGHIEAQAKLGDLLFNGDADYPRPVEGLMWLKIARDSSLETDDELWVGELFEQAAAIATASERTRALAAAKKYGPRFSAN